MRPPNGAADPIKPAQELLGEVLLEAGQPAEAAAAFDACLRAYAEPCAIADGRRSRATQPWATSDLAEARYLSLKSFWKGAAIAAPSTGVDSGAAGREDPAAAPETLRDTPGNGE